MAVILESLQRLQERLIEHSPPEAALLWNYEGSGNQRQKFRPKDEEDLSDRIAAWLADDLGPKSHVVIGREVQPRRGQRTDIKVEAFSSGSQGAESRPLTVVIEVKGCWNKGVRSAVKTQLVEDYLNKNGWTHGVYVVGWYMCSRWDDPNHPATCCLTAKTYEEACKEVEHLTSQYTGGSSSAIVKATCLDCRYPA